MYVILEFFKNLPWSELFGTVIGVVFAFFLPTYYEHRRKIQQQKNALINYYYNLHIIFRNFFGYVIAVHNNMELAGGDINKFIEPSIPDFSFDNVSSDLSFVIKRSDKLYECIVQLKLELNRLNQPNILSNMEHRRAYFQGLAFRSMETGMQICILMTNTKRYLKKYHNQNVSSETAKDNIGRFLEWVNLTLDNIEHKPNVLPTELQEVQDIRKKLQTMKRDWLVKFE